MHALYPLAPVAYVAIKKDPFIGLSHCHTPPRVNGVSVSSSKVSHHIFVCSEY